MLLIWTKNFQKVLKLHLQWKNKLLTNKVQTRSLSGHQISATMKIIVSFFGSRWEYIIITIYINSRYHNSVVFITMLRWWVSLLESCLGGWDNWLYMILWVGCHSATWRRPDGWPVDGWLPGQWATVQPQCMWAPINCVQRALSPQLTQMLVGGSLCV